MRATCWHHAGRDRFDACGADLTWTGDRWACPRGHRLRQWGDLPETTRGRVRAGDPETAAVYQDHRGRPL